MRFSIVLFVILQILPRPYAGNPVGVLLVPLHGVAQPLLERDVWPPAQLALHLAAVDGVTAVVPGTILDVADERARLAHDVQKGQGEVEVGALAAAADVVDFAGPAGTPDAFDGRAM